MLLNHVLSLAIVVVVYLISIGAIALSKDLQTFLVFLPNIRFPLVKLTNLNFYGLEGIARNIEIRTNDGNLLKGWHVYDGISKKVEDSTLTDYHFANSDRIILYFHGNAFTRGFPIRVSKIKKLSRNFDAHVLIFDYSGFADSTGYPSESTALNDALAMLRYVNSTVVENNPSASGWYTHSSSSSDKKQPELYFYGQSLGTGISSALVHHLNSAGFGQSNPISGLILDSPFTSIPDVVGDHILVKYIKPLRDCIKDHFLIRFPTLERLPHVSVPILIMHGARDGTIPVEHSRRLFEAIRAARAKNEAICSSAGGKESCAASGSSRGNELVRYWEVPEAGHNTVFLSSGWTETMQQFLKDVETM